MEVAPVTVTRWLIYRPVPAVSTHRRRSPPPASTGSSMRPDRSPARREVLSPEPKVGLEDPSAATGRFGRDDRFIRPRGETAKRPMACRRRSQRVSRTVGPDAEAHQW